MGTIRQPWGKGAVSSEGQFSGGILEIEINESGQVIELDLYRSTHFRIWVNGNYDFDLPMPINGFDGQPFTVELRGKKMASWDDDAVEACVGFDWRWYAVNLAHMIVSPPEGGNLALKYKIDEYLKKDETFKTFINITDHSGTAPIWILDSIILNDFVLKDDDADGLSYHQGVHIKSLGRQYTYATFEAGELTYGGDW
jgi:hypothetical protein